MTTSFNRSLLALMIISQCVLTAFVVQWLFSEYKNEKTELEKALSFQFEKSQEEVLDTLIEKNLISPLLRSKKGFKMTMHDENIDTVLRKGQVKMIINETNSDTSIVTVTTDSVKMRHRELLSPDSTDYLMHGIRLIVKEVTSDPEHQKEFERRIYAGSDSLLLKKSIEKNFSRSGWKFSMRLKDGNTPDSILHRKSIVLESTVFPKKFGLEISGFSVFLFKQILPQSLFAIVLLLLTGLAFLFSYRSLKNQYRLNMMKNDLIDNISHELKTPLSTVKVVVEALRDENIRRDEKTTRDYLEMAAMEINRLELLTGKILSTSMIEGGIIKMQKEKIDLNKILHDLVFALQVRLANENATINIISDNDAYFISGEILHIQGALLNLIDNSLKYSGGNPLVNITLVKDENQVVLTISDNGPGIPSEYTAKIFEKFFRVPSGNMHNVKGHGLGLSYVHMVMKMHDASVSVSNENGAVFTLTFRAS